MANGKREGGKYETANMKAEGGKYETTTMKHEGSTCIKKTGKLI